MSLALHSKYVYDAAGNIIEVILPIHEFQELQRLAGKYSTVPPAQTGVSAKFREELSAAEMTQIALYGGVFDWLKDEPDLYSDADGEPV